MIGAPKVYQFALLINKDDVQALPLDSEIQIWWCISSRASILRSEI